MDRILRKTDGCYCTQRLDVLHSATYRLIERSVAQMINRKLLEDAYEVARAKRSPVKPKLDTRNLRKAEGKGLCAGLAATAYGIKNVQAEGVELLDMELAKCFISGCTFHGCDFGNSIFEDTLFVDCDFSNSLFALAGFRRCEFTNCKFMGSNLAETLFENTTVRGSILSMASLSHSKWKNAFIEGCDFSGADMSGIEFSFVAFSDSRLLEANLFKTSLKGIDLTTCQIEGIVLSDSLSELFGCRMDIQQLSTFAGMIGVLVSE